MKSELRKFMAVFMAITLLSEIIFPTAAFALTGGPSQPEVQSFEPIGTSEMVDVFSGDFVYNIPLMDVGGYPVNISYHSGVGMDQEASWVGLGWNINMGAITRNMRGLPDDFNGNSGDVVEKEFNIKPNRTYGLTASFGAELFGANLKKLRNKTGIQYTFGLYYNNYRGVGYEISAGFSFGDKNKSSIDLNLGLNSQTGIGFSPNLNFSKKVVDDANKQERISGISVGSGYNSRAGLQELTFGLTSKKEKEVMASNKTTTEISTYGANGGSSISFSNPSYTPAFTMPTLNYNLTLQATIGGELNGFHPKYEFSGYFTEQRLYKIQDNAKAYGYLYSDRGANDDAALHDFNREKDGTFTEESPNLPLTNYTYDIYSVAGQGTGGMYRPYRGDIGIVYDKRLSTGNISPLALGLEFGVGNAAHNGVNYKPAFSFSQSGKWKNHNKVKDDLNFVNPVSVPDNPLYESVAFKQAGEKITVGDQSFLDRIGGTQPVRIALDKKLVDVFAVKKFETKYGGTISIGSINRKLLRDKRNQAISYLTQAEAKEAGLDKNLYDTPWVNAGAKPHHTAEISVINPDGRRYVYGQPAYNNLQREVTFNISGGNSSSCSDGLVTYTGGIDNSLGNNQGIDNYFSRTKLPAYAHSYLLTGVLSTDYVDVMQDGITDDDLGSAVKINYERKSSAYKWRTPYEGHVSDASQSKANYQEGFKSKTNDDKASYVYGEKEIFYVCSLETKTHIAVFTTSQRDDGLAVAGENGGKPSDLSSADNNSFKLDKITLYSKPDYLANGISAVPIKVVHFVYDYSLCPGISNSKNNRGKLTLKKIFFTYGKSQKGKLSPYVFTYKQGVGENPSYNLRGYDRWGNFKPNPINSCGVNDPNLSNIDFPYVDQNKTLADQYVSVWSLKEILLPSGGKIEIDYESDDYAYVQDKRAMQMFLIRGAGSSSNYATGNKLFTKTGSFSSDNYDDNFFLYFDLQKDPNDPSGNTYLTDFKNDYFAGITDMYYNCLVDLTNGGKYEYVSGYAEIESYGIASNDPTKGWVQLKPRKLKDDEDGSSPSVNPISKAAWQFARINLPEYVYPGSNPNGTDESIIKSLAGFWTDLQSLFTGFNRTLRRKEFGSTFVPGKSWIRLVNPSKKKLGGGVRVSEVRINDQWDKMTSSEGKFKYGQHYDYTTTENGRVISSGVASYEPMIGGEENPFRQLATAFVEKHKMAPNDFNYTEDPFGESFFPSASVGYSRVTVKNLPRHQNDDPSQPLIVKRNATGFVVHEFYTAKDFPTIVDDTDVDKSRKKPGFLAKFLKIRVRDLMTASQGYTVELNDMHGKPKAQWVYAEDKPLTPISGVQYFYKTDTNNKKHLNNLCTVIRKDGSVTTANIGVEIDAITDMRQANTESYQSGVEGNLDAFLAIIFPALVPNILPAFASEKTRFRSAVVTKVINRSGVLEKTVAHDLGSAVSTSNLAYDAETGEVLLTRTQNDFEDPVFSFTYPAHWAYEGMGPAYMKTGAYFPNVSVTAGGQLFTPLVDVNNYLVPGDEIVFEKVTQTGGVMEVYGIKAWVYKANGQLYLINLNGSQFGQLPSAAPFTWYAKVIRSGMRNQQITPIGTFTSLSNPLDRDNNGLFDNINHSYNILNASSVEFSDRWGMFCCHALPDVSPVCENLEGAERLSDFFNDSYVKSNILGCTGVSAGEGTYIVTGAVSAGCSGVSSGSFANASINAFCENAEDCQTFASANTETFENEGFCHGIASVSGSSGDNTGVKAAVCVKAVGGNNDEGVPDITDFANPWCQLKNYSPCDGLREVEGFGSATSDGGQLELNLMYSITFHDGSSCGLVLQYEGESPFFFNNVTNFQNLRPDPDFIQSGTNNHFIISAHMNDNSVVDIKGQTDCADLFSCEIPESAQQPECCKQPGNIVNPYIEGLQGNWRAKKSWLYLTDRNQSKTNDNTNIRRDGTFQRFNPFWKTPVNPIVYWQKDETNWTFTSEVTEFSPFGFELENKDALGRHSAALYGYANTLPVAVASNSRFKDIAYDGLEDYDLPGQCATHFSFIDFPAQRTSVESHTGKYSMSLQPTQSLGIIRALTAASVNEQPDDFPYTVKPADCIGQFSPEMNKPTPQNYVLSVWVKQEAGTGSIPVFDYDKIDVQVSLNNTPLTSNLKRGRIIDGWQRLELEFIIPANSSGSITVSLINSSIILNAFFDDIRIHPFNGNMKSFVYDPVNLRLMAELDENNYATFYEYDEEGALIRVKKETERGIMTIQESRNNTQKGIQ